MICGRSHPRAAQHAFVAQERSRTGRTRERLPSLFGHPQFTTSFLTSSARAACPHDDSGRGHHLRVPWLRRAVLAHRGHAIETVSLQQLGVIVGHVGDAALARRRRIGPVHR
jgi:hypothetical protein